MKLFRSTFTFEFDSGKELRLTHRPSLLYTVLSLGFLGQTVLCWFPLQWPAFFASLIFAFPAFILGVLVWTGWSTAVIPKAGQEIRWQDGLISGRIPGGDALAASVEISVQPGLHKGPGPTAYINLWAADRRVPKPADPWRRIFSFEQSSQTHSSLPLSEQHPKIAAALLELGYLPELPAQPGASAF